VVGFVALHYLTMVTYYIPALMITLSSHGDWSIIGKNERSDAAAAVLRIFVLP
jgi:hypothetical protein